MQNQTELIQLEKVDKVCLICGIRHIPKYIERLCDADPELDQMLFGPRRRNPLREGNWLNLHLFTKRAFVPLNF